MGRLLSIDYGLKRVGIAVSDPLKIIATGLKTVENKELFDFLKAYTIENEVEAFIVGDPANLDDTPTHLTEPVNKLIEKLTKQFPDIPIHRVNEQFSSKRAMQSLIQSGVRKKNRRNKALLDEVSATIILQDFMYEQE